MAAHRPGDAHAAEGDGLMKVKEREIVVSLLLRLRPFQIPTKLDEIHMAVAELSASDKKFGAAWDTGVIEIEIEAERRQKYDRLLNQAIWEAHPNLTGAMWYNLKSSVYQGLVDDVKRRVWGDETETET